jgi:hypothetical protein
MSVRVRGRHVAIRPRVNNPIFYRSPQRRFSISPKNTKISFATDPKSPKKKPVKFKLPLEMKIKVITKKIKLGDSRRLPIILGIHVERAIWEIPRLASRLFRRASMTLSLAKKPAHFLHLVQPKKADPEDESE